MSPECPDPCPVHAIRLHSVILLSWLSVSTVLRTVLACGKLKAKGKQAVWLVIQKQAFGTRPRLATCFHIIHYAILKSGAAISSSKNEDQDTCSESCEKIKWDSTQLLF